jgi:nucleoside-diphosphate-sugar epimerase
LQSRDFTYIDNVVQANLQAAHSKLGSGGVFNVGEGKSHTLLELVDLLEEIIGTKLKLLHTAERAGDIRYTQAERYLNHNVASAIGHRFLLKKVWQGQWNILASKLLVIPARHIEFLGSQNNYKKRRKG